jgi:hypothetical protein
MYSENGVLVDFDEISKLVADADVFTVAFGNFPERLVVDTRSNQRERPMVQVVEPVGGARERLSWLNRRRPSLGMPKAMSFFAWPHSPSFMLETGVWKSICTRVDADMDPAVEALCEEAIKQLHNLDVEASYAVLRGERTITLWPRDDDGK